MSRPQQGLAFALAGQIVRTPQHATRVLIEAQRDGREWLVPQARNVAAKLRRAREGGAA